MNLKLILLKLKFPLLKCINFIKTGGIYSSDGLDLYLFQVFFNIFNNAEANCILELNKINQSLISEFNLFIKFFPSTQYINIDNKLNKVTFNNYEFSNSINLSQSNFVDVGIVPDLKNKYSTYIYNQNDNLLYNVLSEIDKITLLSIEYNNEAYKLLDEIIGKKKIYGIIIQNTNTYNKKINDLRIFLLNNGYIFLSRINNQNDLFLLTETINGFPSSLFNYLNSSTLAKWISIPNDFDYTKPR